MNIVGIFVLKTLFLLFQASQYGFLHLADVCTKERGHIPPFVVPSYISNLPTFVDRVSQTYLHQCDINNFGVPFSVTANAVVCLTLFRYHSVVPKIWQLNYVYVLA